MKTKYILGAMTFVITLLSMPIIAFAHVHVEPDQAVKGTTQTFMLHIPNEDAKQKTTKIEIQIPQESGSPITTVEVKESSGWDSELTKTGDLVSKVTFTGGELKGEEEGEFSLELGPLPTDVDKLMLKTIQTYDGGKVASWIQEQVGSEEPEYPVPTISLVKSSKDIKASDSHDDDHHSSDAKKSDSKSDSDKDEKNDDNTIIYLVAGAAIIVLAAGALAFIKKK